MPCLLRFTCLPLTASSAAILHSVWSVGCSGCFVLVTHASNRTVSSAMHVTPTFGGAGVAATAPHVNSMSMVVCITILATGGATELPMTLAATARLVGHRKSVSKPPIRPSCITDANAAFFMSAASPGLCVYPQYPLPLSMYLFGIYPQFVLNVSQTRFVHRMHACAAPRALK